MLSRAPSRTVPASKLLFSRSPQLRLSSHSRKIAGAPLFTRPTTAAPEPAATPPQPTGAPPLLHQSSTPKTAGLFLTGTTSSVWSYTTSATRTTSSPLAQTSSRPNSSKIPASRTAQIARHLSGSSSITSTNKMAYSVRKVAAPYTLEHRVYIEKDGVPVSPFHDIPLFANQEQTILNMVVEIPRWTNAKLEVSWGSLKRSDLRRCRGCERRHTMSLNKRKIRTCRTDESHRSRSPRRSS